MTKADRWLDKDRRWGDTGKITKSVRKILEVLNVFFYFDGGDGFMSIYLRQNLLNCTLEVCSVYYTSIITQSCSFKNKSTSHRHTVKNK